MASEQAEKLGDLTTLKPSVAQVQQQQPIRIVTHADEQDSSRDIAAGMAARHASDPSDFHIQPCYDDEVEGDAGKKDKDSGSSKLKSGLMIYGLVAAVLGAVCVFASRLGQKPSKS